MDDRYAELLCRYKSLRLQHLWRRAVIIHEIIDPFLYEEPAWLTALLRREKVWWQEHDQFYFAKPAWMGALRKNVRPL